MINRPKNKKCLPLCLQVSCNNTDDRIFHKFKINQLDEGGGLLFAHIWYEKEFLAPEKEGTVIIQNLHLTYYKS